MYLYSKHRFDSSSRFPGTANRGFDISAIIEDADMGVKGQTLVINVTQQEKSPKSIFFNQG